MITTNSTTKKNPPKRASKKSIEAQMQELALEDRLICATISHCQKELQLENKNFRNSKRKRLILDILLIWGPLVTGLLGHLVLRKFSGFDVLTLFGISMLTSQLKVWRNERRGIVQKPLEKGKKNLSLLQDTLVVLEERLRITRAKAKAIKEQSQISESDFSLQLPFPHEAPVCINCFYFGKEITQWKKGGEIVDGHYGYFCSLHSQSTCAQCSCKDFKNARTESATRYAEKALNTMREKANTTFL